MKEILIHVRFNTNNALNMANSAAPDETPRSTLYVNAPFLFAIVHIEFRQATPKFHNLIYIYSGYSKDYFKHFKQMFKLKGKIIL